MVRKGSAVQIRSWAPCISQFVLRSVMQLPMRLRKPRNLCKNCSVPVKRPCDVFCSSTCQHALEYNEYIRKWLAGKVDGTTVGGISGYIRRYLSKTYGNKCFLCGWQEQNPVTGRVPLEVDHINGNYRDSTPGNLRLICPNCHSLTPTFRNLNKGKGREKRMASLLSSVGRAPHL